MTDKATRSQVNNSYCRLPLHFELNRGQTSEQVKFLSRGKDYSLFLTPQEAVLALSTGRGREEEIDDLVYIAQHLIPFSPSLLSALANAAFRTPGSGGIS